MRLAINQSGLRQGLIAFAVLGFFAGAALWLWNPEPDLTSREAGPAKNVAKAADDSLQLPAVDRPSIVAANIFAASRTPPSRRYNPADDQFAEGAEAVPEMNAVEALQAPPHLFGTVVGPGGAMALMQSDSANGPGKLFREGERVGIYRLVKINANSVVVSGPSGRLEIQVQRNPTGAQ